MKLIEIVVCRTWYSGISHQKKAPASPYQSGVGVSDLNCYYIFFFVLFFFCTGFFSSLKKLQYKMRYQGKHHLSKTGPKGYTLWCFEFKTFWYCKSLLMQTICCKTYHGKNKVLSEWVPSTVATMTKDTGFTEYLPWTIKAHPRKPTCSRISYYWITYI